MKNGILPIISLLALLFFLQNCKPEKPSGPVDPNDSDSLYIGTTYIIQKPFRFPNINNAYKDSVTYEGIELGRRLFYDVRLSSTGMLACASCHKPELAFTDGLVKSVNVFGPTLRNTPAIQNLLWTNKLFWDGRVNTLADQAKDAYHGEQNLNIPDAVNFLQADTAYLKLFKKAFGRPGVVTEEKIYLAVQQFMMTAISANSRFDKIQRGEDQFTTSEANGFVIFSTEKGECFHCHTDGSSLLMTDNLFRNNGLDSAAGINDFTDKGRGAFTSNVNDNGKFKDPSLRNIALTAPYMHDGRYQTLEQVINFYSDSVKFSPTVDPLMYKVPHTNGKFNLTSDEKTDLLNFLLTLTDTTFTNNAAFKNPF